MSKRDLYIKAQKPGTSYSFGWIRNPDWLSLPDISNTTGKLVGLFLVYEDEIDNSLRFVSHPNNNYTVDWGDGSAIGTSVSGTIQYTYNYSTLSSSISVDEQGRNYKQVVFEVNVILFQQPTSQFGPRNANTTNYSYNIADVISTLPSLFSNNATLPALERLIQTNVTSSTLNLSGQYAGAKMPKLRIFELNPVTHNFAQTAFQSMGFIEEMDIDFLSSISTLAVCFDRSRMKRLKLKTVSSVASNLCRDCHSLFEAYIEGPGVTTYAGAWSNNTSLRKLEVYGMSTVTTFTTPLTNCTNLETVIFDGLTLGFSVNGSRMTATALNALMTSLGNANGSQNLDFRNTPGAATCDTTIATSKGYTVTII